MAAALGLPLPAAGVGMGGDIGALVNAAITVKEQAGLPHEAPRTTASPPREAILNRPGECAAPNWMSDRAGRPLERATHNVAAALAPAALARNEPELDIGNRLEST